jgi:hypothetical protein
MTASSVQRYPLQLVTHAPHVPPSVRSRMGFGIGSASDDQPLFDLDADSERSGAVSLGRATIFAGAERTHAVSVHYPKKLLL